MKVSYGKGKTEFGPGVEINLTGDEVATDGDSYLVAHDIIVRGARTITVNGELIEDGEVYVDPSGFAMEKGVRFEGRGLNVI